MVLLSWLALAHGQSVVLEHRIPTTTELGLVATALGGFDGWATIDPRVPGGGGSGEARLSAGLAHGWRQSTVRVGYAALVQGWAEDGVLDGQLLRVGVRRGASVGGEVCLRSSASQQWVELAPAFAFERTGWSVRVAPLVRTGLDWPAPGLRAEVRGNRSVDRWTLGGLVRLTAHQPEAVPHLGVVQGLAEVDLGREVSVGAAGSGLLALGGEPVSVLGLPPGRSGLVRAEGWVLWWLGRSIAAQVELASERGLGSVPYVRGRVFGGVRVALGRVRTPIAETPAGSVRFELEAPEAESVSVSGSFTDWEPVQMVREGGVWVTEIVLSPGVHEYVYLVDGTPMIPPEAASTREDGFGGRNGVVVVGGAAM